MLISIMQLKFESTIKIDQTWWRHHFEDNEYMQDIKRSKIVWLKMSEKHMSFTGLWFHS